MKAANATKALQEESRILAELLASRGVATPAPMSMDMNAPRLPGSATGAAAGSAGGVSMEDMVAAALYGGSGAGSLAAVFDSGLVDSLQGQGSVKGAGVLSLTDRANVSV